MGKDRRVQSWREDGFKTMAWVSKTEKAGEEKGEKHGIAHANHTDVGWNQRNIPKKQGVDERLISWEKK